jgi:hypothetical protein
VSAENSKHGEDPQSVLSLKQIIPWPLLMIIMLYPCQGLQTLHENRPLRAIAASSSVPIPFMKGEPGHPTSNEQQGPGLPASADSDLEAKGVPVRRFPAALGTPSGLSARARPPPGPRLFIPNVTVSGTNRRGPGGQGGPRGTSSIGKCVSCP